MLKVYAPAKLNLVLEVLGKDNDYHQISSIVQTINLCDTLNFELEHEIQLNCNEPSLELDNLAIEAAELLRKVTHCSKGARIELYKHIPWGVGLGGGSSDAAATLLALNELWGLRLPISELAHLASKLGSDVPFFIYGGTALVEGVGGKVKPLPSLCPTWFVLLVPPLPKIAGKTRQLYNRLTTSHFTKGQLVHAALPLLRKGKMIDPSLMFNVFEEVAFNFSPKLNAYRTMFEEAGASKVYLAGSGPCLFTFASEEKQAKVISLNLKGQGLECYVTSPFTRD
jgi:4-diphosphocytidyl-2-C-methyl-D-erythritol kinase